MKYSISKWINETVKSSTSNWAVITFRCDGYVINGHGIKQSVWGDGATSPKAKIEKALEWTITEFKRKHGRKLKFASYFGGEQSIGVFPHIHALLELPVDLDINQLTQYLSTLWKRKLLKTLNA